MKFLKLLLVIFLLTICLGLVAVFFQNTIISHMTKTDKSEFLNARYSINTNELLFDDFVVNGKKLGKGKAKVGIERTGTFGLIPKIKLSEMKLENLDLNTVYTAPNALIDGFMEKIDSSENKGETEKKTTEEYIAESTKEIGILNARIDDFLNNKVKTEVEKTNKIKEDYNVLTNLKSKIEKASELNREAAPLIKMINDEKEKLEYTVSDIEANKSIMLTDIAEELTKLENIVSLNDVQNINSYIFLDRKKEVVQSLNQTLKIAALINEIKNISIDISDINVNDGKIKISGMNGKNSALRGEIQIDNNSRVDVKGIENGYNLNYVLNDLIISSVMENDKKINTTVTYEKKDILEGKTVNLVSELIFNNNELQSVNKTVLTEEEKILLTEKIKTMETNRYDEIMNVYNSQTAKVDELIAGIYRKKEKLDKVQKELLSLNTLIRPEDIIIPETVSEETEQREQTQEQNTGNAEQNDTAQQNDRQSSQNQMQEILNKITDKK